MQQILQRVSAFVFSSEDSDCREGFCAVSLTVALGQRYKALVPLAGRRCQDELRREADRTTAPITSEMAILRQRSGVLFRIIARDAIASARLLRPDL